MFSTFPEHISNIVNRDGPLSMQRNSFAYLLFSFKRADCNSYFLASSCRYLETMPNKPVYCIPMGVKKDFWTRVEG